jgi:beta-lactamase regulating signal transducer with metallopeptidase domain
MNAAIESFSRNVIEAAINGGLQGMLVAAAAIVALGCLRRSNAATRHAICFLTLVFVAALPVIHLARNYLPEPKTVLEIPAPSVPSEAVIDVPEEADRLSFDSRPVLREIESGEPAAIPESGPAENALAEPTRAVAMEDTVRGSEPSRSPWRTFTFAFPRAIPALVALSIVSAWAVLALCRLGFLGGQLRSLSKFKKYAEKPSPEALQMFDGIRAATKLDRDPRLLISPEVNCAMAVGYFRPAVLIPRAPLSNEQLGQILRHELAHIARRDDWGSLLQHGIQALFFFHPAVWWISRRLAIEREIACDDHVISQMEGRKSYALLLTEFASQSVARRWTAAPAVWGGNSQLKRRIDMILDTKRNASPQTSRRSVGIVSAAVAALAAYGIIAAPRVAFAHSDSAPTPAITEVRVVNEEVPPPPPVAEVLINDESGPRIKTVQGRHVAVFNQSSSANSAQLTVTPPAPGAVPEPATVTAVAPMPTATPAVSSWGTARVVVDDAVKVGWRRDESLERRIERLERLVQELAGREKGFKGEKMEKMEKNFFKGPDGAGFGVMRSEDMARIQEEAQRDAKRETERAHRDMERAHREMERAMEQAHKDMAKAGMEEHHGADKEKGKQLKMARKQLEAQQKALEAELRKIEHSIDKLQNEEEQIREKAEQAREQAENENHNNKRNRDEKNEKNETHEESSDKPLTKEAR